MMRGCDEREAVFDGDIEERAVAEFATGGFEIAAEFACADLAPMKWDGVPTREIFDKITIGECLRALTHVMDDMGERDRQAMGPHRE